MAISMWLKRDLQTNEAHDILDKLSELPDKLEAQLHSLSEQDKLVKKYANYKNFFFMNSYYTHKLRSDMMNIIFTANHWKMWVPT